MAELVDALDSKSGYRKVVQVRFLFWALDYQVVRKVTVCDLSKFANNLQTNQKPTYLLILANFIGKVKKLLVVKLSFFIPAITFTNAHKNKKLV